nr:vesicular integral-membrane protein VIP36-like [Pocillopora verrucosa]
MACGKTYLTIFLLFLLTVLLEVTGCSIGSVSSNLVRFPPDNQSKRGASWSILSYYIKDWDMLVNFKVHGESDTLFQGGCAFWYSTRRMQEGNLIGVFSYNYSNHNGEHRNGNLYISVMVGNGSCGTHVAGCSQSFLGRGHVNYVLICYSGTQNYLTIQVDVANKNEWKVCFDVVGRELPTRLYFGKTVDNNEIKYVNKMIRILLSDKLSEGVDEDRTKIGSVCPATYVDRIVGGDSDRIRALEPYHPSNYALLMKVEIGQNGNEIGNIKIITNLLAEYYSHLKGYLKRKLP